MTLKSTLDWQEIRPDNLPEEGIEVLIGCERSPGSSVHRGMIEILKPNQPTHDWEFLLVWRRSVNHYYVWEIVCSDDQWIDSRYEEEDWTHWAYLTPPEEVVPHYPRPLTPEEEALLLPEDDE